MQEKTSPRLYIERRFLWYIGCDFEIVYSPATLMSPSALLLYHTFRLLSRVFSNKCYQRRSPLGGRRGGTLRPQSPLVPTAVDFLVVFALLALGMWFSSILDCMLQYSVNFLWKTVNFRTY